MTVIELSELTNGTEYSLYLAQSGSLQLFKADKVFVECGEIDTMEVVIKHLIFGDVPV